MPGRVHAAFYRNRRGQLERAGVVHRQHRRRAAHIPREGEKPQAQAKGDGHQPVGQLVGVLLRGGFAAERVLQKAPGAGHAGFSANGARGYFEPPVLHQRAGQHLAAQAGLHGQALPGDGAAVERRLAVHHHAVHGNQLARAANDHIAHGQVGKGQAHLAGIALHPHAFHLGAQQVLQKLVGLGGGPLLQPVAQAQHGHNGVGGEVVAPQERKAHGGGVEHFHLYALGKQRAQAVGDGGQAQAPTYGRFEPAGQKGRCRCRHRLADDRGQGQGGRAVLARQKGLAGDVLHKLQNALAHARAAIVPHGDAGGGAVDARLGNAGHGLKHGLQVAGVQGGIGQGGGAQPQASGHLVGHPDALRGLGRRRHRR